MAALQALIAGNLFAWLLVFTRVGSAMMVLPVFGDRCLVGRQAAWVVNRFSALAGFLEPGESIEEACAVHGIEVETLIVELNRFFAAQAKTAE